MANLSNKLRQFQYKIKHSFSIENIALIIAICLCLTWTYQSIIAMNRNWELTDRLNSEKKSLALLEVEIETAELENEYLKTAEYQELAARKLLDKALPGEHMVVLPENSELAKTKHQTISVTTETNTKNYSNPEKWLLYLNLLPG